jgi:hypothetical protein
MTTKPKTPPKTRCKGVQATDPMPDTRKTDKRRQHRIDGREKALRDMTDNEISLYRAKLSCKIGRDAIEGTTRPPDGCSPIEYAVFNLLHAVSEIAAAMNAQGG